VPKETKDEIKEIFGKTGIGNYPAIVKFFHTVGKSISEDKFVEGKNVSLKTSEDILFGDAFDIKNKN
jgi:hypothetical protein